VGGTAEIFPPGSGSALLVPPDDPEALADAVLEVLRDRSRREPLGAAARRRAEETFDADRAAGALAGHYREVVGNRLAGG
jgi:glycosyltransferase involved in cell wall biosynthesis